MEREREASNINQVDTGRRKTGMEGVRGAKTNDGRLDGLMGE